MGKMVSGVLLSVVLIIFASGAVAFYTIFFRPEGEVVVPPLKGSSVVEAVAEAERLGLAVQIEQVESTLPEGRVLAQSPETGARLRKGKVVILQVSRSGELHAVPDVRGQTLAQAQSVIQEQGFMVGDVIRVPITGSFPVGSGGQPGGAVIAQSPASPANISVTRKIDLLIREGGEGGDEKTVTIPDVNRMTEQEARKLLASLGLKIQATDRVYSPMIPEGSAIETRPGAGTAVRAGEGVRLKIATQTRPAGFTEASTTPEGNGSARKVTSQPVGNQPQPSATGTGSSSKAPSGVTVSVPGQGDIFIGDGTPAKAPVKEADPNVSVIDQERQKPQGGAGAPTPSAPSKPTAPAASDQPAQAPSGGASKKARIRYQVPPLSSPLTLRIELTDPSGKRDVLNRPAKSGESVVVEAPYTQECVVSIYLGGDFVWQEKHR